MAATILADYLCPPHPMTVIRLEINALLREFLPETGPSTSRFELRV
jgi:hypothetical protein